MRRIKGLRSKNWGVPLLWAIVFSFTDLVEKLSGQSFDQFLDSHFYDPMGIERLTFNPSFKFPKEEIISYRKGFFI